MLALSISILISVSEQIIQIRSLVSNLPWFALYALSALRISMGAVPAWTTLLSSCELRVISHSLSLLGIACFVLKMEMGSSRRLAPINLVWSLWLP